MNSFTNALLTLLLGWLRTLLNVARDFISSDSSTVWFDFFRHNWKILFLVLCIGGFAMDKLVYLIRWRPRPIWIRLRIKRQNHRRPPQTGAAFDRPVYAGYDPPEFYDDSPVIPQETYQPTMPYSAVDAAPTIQYQKPYPSAPAADLQRAGSPYSTPQLTPDTAAPEEYPPYQAQPPSWEDDPTQGQPYTPPAEPQNFAFGMAPSFGSAQSEPTYTYYQETTPSFEPPQYARRRAQPQPYQPLEPESIPYEPEDAPQSDYQEPGPTFRPFSDRDNDNFAPPKAGRFGSVARKARNLLKADEEYQSLTYQDLQPTVDVKKAFHSPVYPKKRPEGD